MEPWSIHLADANDAPDALPSLVERLSAAWLHPHRVAFTVSNMGSLEEATCDAVVLRVSDEAGARRAGALADMLEDRGISVLAITSPGINVVGAALTSPDATDDARLTARLTGLLHRQGEIRRLRQELAIARRSHGGMHGEITRMHEELQFASQVQRDLLPESLPALNGVQFAVLWRPSNYVSGDVYGVQRLDEDHIGFFIADCVGHGVPAALMTMIVCRALEMTEIVNGEHVLLEPSEVLSRLNSAMVQHLGSGSRFATGMCGRINCRTRELRIAGAGHPAALLLHPHRDMVQIESEGGLLGIFEAMDFPQTTHVLDEEHRLILHTDGFEQAFPADEGDAKLPTDRYLDEFSQLAGDPDPEAMITTVAGRLDGERGSLHQADDLTLLCMHVGRVVAETAAAA